MRGEIVAMCVCITLTYQFLNRTAEKTAADSSRIRAPALHDPRANARENPALVRARNDFILFNFGIEARSSVQITEICNITNASNAVKRYRSWHALTWKLNRAKYMRHGHYCRYSLASYTHTRI